MCTAQQHLKRYSTPAGVVPTTTIDNFYKYLNPLDSRSEPLSWKIKMLTGLLDAVRFGLVSFYNKVFVD